MPFMWQHQAPRPFSLTLWDGQSQASTLPELGGHANFLSHPLPPPTPHTCLTEASDKEKVGKGIVIKAGSLVLPCRPGGKRRPPRSASDWKVDDVMGKCTDGEWGCGWGDGWRLLSLCYLTDLLNDQPTFPWAPSRSGGSE
ncbi:Zinc finger protein 34 [Clarias magur]|uniref:Zinc finger protein 34 n=1 Tax=Clarias magur TaxID=1594786 RepID=A0A8J4URZ1_CLAMG|nr:Zinc finger protein 34 [Clarias magur]